MAGLHVLYRHVWAVHDRQELSSWQNKDRLVSTTSTVLKAMWLATHAGVLQPLHPCTHLCWFFWTQLVLPTPNLC